MHAPPDLRDTQPRNFFRATRDEDHFTIVYELAHSEEPVTVEALGRTFRANMGYVSGILSQLRRLGIAAKVGRRWVISSWAREMLHFLEDYTKTVTPEAPEPLSDSFTLELNPVIPASGPGTYNGLWTGVASQVTVADRLTGFGSGGSTIADQRGLAPETSYRGQNESLSHDYK